MGSRPPKNRDMAWLSSGLHIVSKSRDISHVGQGLSARSFFATLLEFNEIGKHFAKLLLILVHVGFLHLQLDHQFHYSGHVLHQLLHLPLVC